MSRFEILKPIMMFGYFFVGLGIIGFLMHFVALNDARYTYSFEFFVVALSLFHIFIGLGVIFKKMWGFYFLKLYLYLLYLAIPIGTYVAVKTFKYIKTYNIERYFQ